MKELVILDRNKKVFFLQVPKTASTSTFNAFKIYHSDILVDMKCLKMASVLEFKQMLEDFEDYQGYAIVRNPFEQVVSWFAYLVRLTGHIKDPTKYYYDPETIKRFVDKRVINYDIHTRQSHFVTIDNKIPGNLHIFKYEDGFANMMRYMNETHGYRMTYSFSNRTHQLKKERVLAFDYMRENIIKHLEYEFDLLGYPKEL